MNLNDMMFCGDVHHNILGFRWGGMNVDFKI